MDITLYTTGCPRCEVLEKKLDRGGLPYNSCFDIEKMLDLGISTVPVLEVDNVRMDFKKAVEWLKEQEYYNEY